MRRCGACDVAAASWRGSAPECVFHYAKRYCSLIYRAFVSQESTNPT